MIFEEQLAKEIADILREHVAAATKQLRDRVVELEAQVKFLKETGLNYRGTFEEGKQYDPGDAVTSGESLWRAHGVTKVKPPGENWRLVARKGRDGKDAGR